MMSASKHGYQRSAGSGGRRMAPIEPKKPNSGRQMKDSKPRSGSSSSRALPNRNNYGTSSLQLLKSDNVLHSDLDLHLEELANSYSDYSDDQSDDDTIGITGRTADVFGIPEPLTDRNKQSAMGPDQFELEPSDEEEDDYMALRQIALMESEANEVDVDSEEERDIMAEIRAEITDKVREEMKSELEVYQKARERLERGDEEQAGTGQDIELDGMEPKLKEAILKMRKLDKILDKKMKREKQVKRDRIMLQKRLRKELEDLKTDPEKTVTADEKKNTEKFIMLALPPSHNSGISLEQPENPEADSPTSVTPVFQTQLPDDAGTQSKEPGTESRASARSRTGSGRQTRTSGNKSGASSVSGVSTMTTDSSGKPIKRKNKKKDFIKRNIQLASDAANTIAMTDDEKKRLEDLLSDLDGLSEIPEEGATPENVSPSQHLSQLMVPIGDGFLPSVEDRQQLQRIDSRLRMLMPPDDFESIASSSPRLVSSTGSMLFTKTSLSSLATITEGELGEHVLKETKDNREKQENLRKIEEELNKLTNAVESEMQSPRLSESQLNKLLDDCARTMSRVTEETNSIAAAALTNRTASSLSTGQASSLGTGPASSRASTVRSSLYENPPHLPQSVLEQLLSDARRSMSGEVDTHRTHNSNTGLDRARLHRNDDLVLESLTEDSVRSSRASSRPDSQSSQRCGLSARQHRVKESNLYQNPGTLGGRSSTEDDRQPFLPEIDPLGRLSTQRLPSQRLNNESSSRPTSRSLTSVYTVRNSLRENTNTADHKQSSSSDDDHSTM